MQSTPSQHQQLPGNKAANKFVPQMCLVTGWAQLLLLHRGPTPSSEGQDEQKPSFPTLTFPGVQFAMLHIRILLRAFHTDTADAELPASVSLQIIWL